MSIDKIFEMSRIGRDAVNNEIPVSVSIELLTKCNWRCKHCYIPEHNNSGLSFKILKRLVDELRKIGVFHILLTGGEIFLRDDILDIVEYIRSKHIRVNILSNASLIDDSIAKKLKELYISDFSLTIFSLNDKIHDGITGVKGSLSSALKGIQYLEKNNIPIEVKTPIMKDNFTEYRTVEKYCIQKGYMFSTSSYITPKTNGDMDVTDNNINEEQIRDVISDLDRIANYQPQKQFSKYMCEILRQSFFISCEGDIYPCNGLYIKTGNIKEKSIDEIWNSKKLSEIRNLTTNNITECQNCNYRIYCERCIGLVYAETYKYEGCSAICKNIAIARNKEYNKEVT